MSPTSPNPIVMTELPADPELDRDDIRLLRSCNYKMDFSEIDATEVQLRLQRRRRRSRTNTAILQRLRESRESVTTSVNRPAARRPAMSHASRTANWGDSTTAASTETRLAEYLQLSISFTASLADNATTGDEDDCWYVFEDDVSVHTPPLPSVAARGKTAQHRRRRRRPQGDNESSAASSSEGRNDRTKRPARRRMPTSGPRCTKKCISSGKKLSSLAEAATSSIECPICLCNYDENQNRVPCTFLCGHSMCLSHKNDLSSCPICRVPFTRRALKKSIVLCQAAAAINDLVSVIEAKNG